MNRIFLIVEWGQNEKKKERKCVNIYLSGVSGRFGSFFNIYFDRNISGSVSGTVVYSSSRDNRPDKQLYDCSSRDV